MVVRASLVALLLYVALDCANPLMPGAVCFDPDASVEATGGARCLRPVAVVGAAVAPEDTVRSAPEPRPCLGTPSLPVTDPGASPRARSALHRSAEPSPEAH